VVAEPGVAIRPDLLPSTEELVRLRLVAAGAVEADVAVRGGRVLSVHTGEFLERDVLVAGRHIAAVTPPGRLGAAREIDARGHAVVPTFIDAHLHIEFTMLLPGELARLSVPRGTVTVLTDPNCMANVAGVVGMNFMRVTGTPLRIFEQVTPLTPAFGDVEIGGARIAEHEVAERLAEPFAVTLGESSPFDLSTVAAARYARTLALGRRITGHTARLSGEPLWSYLAAGVGDDHNAATVDEALDRVRLGAMITLMAGSMNDNVAAVFADLERIAPAYGHICFCADDKHVADLVEQGHIDHHVREAIRAGVPVEVAYRMASWNPALYYRLDHLVGSLTPTRLADLALIGDLERARPDLVMVGGAVVAEGGRPLFTNPDRVPEWTRETVRIAPSFAETSLRVPAAGPAAWVQAMEMYDGYFKRAFHARLAVVDGNVVADPERDVLKIAVVDRHHAEPYVGVGFVRGFGLRSGALAVSTNCPNCNIVVVGVTEGDMVRAVRALRESGGGFVVVDGGEVRGAVGLPVGGLMSTSSWETVEVELRAAEDAAAMLGCAVPSPFMILSFVGLAAVPDLGLTELGMVEAASQTLVPTVLPGVAPTGAPGVHCRCPNHGHPVHVLMDPATASAPPISSAPAASGAPDQPGAPYQPTGATS
jgi:adenine deaminase